MPVAIRLALIASLLALTLAAPCPAQDEAAPPIDEIPKLEPYDPLTVTPDELRLRLRSYRKAALEEEVEAWLQRLQANAEQISAADIAARGMEGEEQQRLIAISTRLKEERAALLERSQLVIDLLEKRGGEVAEAEDYVKTVAGGLTADLSIDVTEGHAIRTAWNTLVAWAKSKEGGLKVLTNVGKFMATVIAAFILAGILARLTRTSLRRFGRTSTLLSQFLVTLVRRIVLLVGLVIALAQLGVDIGPLVAAIGAAGLVIGFALQGTLSNFASGILILLYRPFDVGDAVEVAGVAGKVEAMTMVSTSIATFDNQLLVIPNNSVWNNVIKNVTGKATRRIDMTFGIGYDDDIEQARSILEEIVKGHDLVLADPAPVIRLHELADSSVNFIVRPWAKTEDYWSVHWDLTRRVKERFDEEGISIPYPQRDVHLHRVEAADDA